MTGKKLIIVCGAILALLGGFALNKTLSYKPPYANVIRDIKLGMSLDEVGSMLDKNRIGYSVEYSKYDIHMTVGSKSLVSIFRPEHILYLTFSRPAERLCLAIEETTIGLTDERTQNAPIGSREWARSTD